LNYIVVIRINLQHILSSKNSHNTAKKLNNGEITIL
jgi:hypothetical protein